MYVFVSTGTATSKTYMYMEYHAHRALYCINANSHVHVHVLQHCVHYMYQIRTQCTGMKEAADYFTTRRDKAYFIPQGTYTIMTSSTGSQS